MNHNRRSPVVRAAVILLVSVLATGAAATAYAGINASSGRIATSSTSGDSVDLSAGFPEGLVGIADNDGQPVGFVHKQAIEGGADFPSLELGSGKHSVTGLEVTNEAGERVGFFLTWIGFVDNATASDPAQVDRLLDENAAIRARAQSAEEQLVRQSENAN